jgi:hypothetical protein
LVVVEERALWLVWGKILRVANIFERRDVARKIVRHVLGGLKRKKIVVESAVGDAWQSRVELLQVCCRYSCKAKIHLLIEQGFVLL